MKQQYLKRPNKEKKENCSMYIYDPSIDDPQTSCGTYGYPPLYSYS